MKNFIVIIIALLSQVTLAQESIRPWLGVSIEKGEQGVFVKNAIPGTPAEKAGILSGDEILSIDGKVVKSPEELITTIVSKGVGFTVKVELLRKKNKTTKDITLVARPDMLKLANQALLNKKAPTFEAHVIKGIEKEKFTDKDLKGVTIIEFWATWCPACIASYPRLVEFAKENKEKLSVITVTGEDPVIVKKFLAKYAKALPEIKDAPLIYLQSKDGKMPGDFFASAIPMFILIDSKGNVVKLAAGGGAILEDILAQAKVLLK